MMQFKIYKYKFKKNRLIFKNFYKIYKKIIKFRHELDYVKNKNFFKKYNKW